VELERNSFAKKAGLALGAVTLAAVVLLFAQDVIPRRFPAGSHEVLGAFSLAAIAVAYLIFQIGRRPRPVEWLKAALLAAAFLFWAANQFWPGSPHAGLYNDIAVGLFVLDVFLVILGWPQPPKESAFAEAEDRTVHGTRNCVVGGQRPSL